MNKVIFNNKSVSQSVRQSQYTCVNTIYKEHSSKIHQIFPYIEIIYKNIQNMPLKECIFTNERDIKYDNLFNKITFITSKLQV